MRLIVVLLLAAGTSVPLGAQEQQGSPVIDMMIRGRNALYDLKYQAADSIARRLLALGTLLSKQQQIDALQLRAAALYPEEAAEQRHDTAIAVVRELVGLGATGLPRELSWAGLDSLFAFVVRAAQPAKVLLGSRVPASVLYVDGQPQGVIQGLRVVQVPTGRAVRLSIQAEGCIPWDSTVTTQPADSVRIGIRNPRCIR